ncbi:MAG: coaE [Rickettsiaceae bacterium]|jgi:dephospho-CoA kinase|nr:coaE [Rickettsiaceae bacterium]
MKLIAITGSIASGKTFTSSIIENHGYPVFYCDKYVASLYDDKEFSKKLEYIFPAIKPISKANISKRIFDDEQEKSKLEKLVHPLVETTILQFIDKCRSKGARLVFVEIPLLFETNKQNLFDYIITVTCSDEVREKRALERSGMTREKLKKILNNQIPDKLKVGLSDFVLHSDNNQLVFSKDVLELIKKLEKLCER